jgi:hypothetical protein
VNTAMNFRFPQNPGTVWSTWATVSFSRKTRLWVDSWLVSLFVSRGLLRYEHKVTHLSTNVSEDRNTSIFWVEIGHAGLPEVNKIDLWETGFRVCALDWSGSE